MKQFLKINKIDLVSTGIKILAVIALLGAIINIKDGNYWLIFNVASCILDIYIFFDSKQVSKMIVNLIIDLKS